MSKLTIEERVEIIKQADALGSDGCTVVGETYHICCLEHDIPYRTGKNFKGESVTKSQTDKRFLQCMQEESKFGKWAILPYLRWFGVAVLNWNGGWWNKEGKDVK